MKKFVSVALATAMIASLGVTAFADTKYDYDVKNIELATNTNGFGATNNDDELYYPLWVTKGPNAPGYIYDNPSSGQIGYDDVEDIDDLKVTIKLTGGSEYVADYYIDEIDNSDAPAYLDGVYAVIIELNDNYTTSKQKIKGEITIKNKTKKLDERDFSYNHDVVKLDVSENNSGEVNAIPEAEFDGEDVYINLVEFNNGSTYSTSTTAKVYNYTVNGVACYSADGKNFYTDDECTTEATIPGADGTPVFVGNETPEVKAVYKWTAVDHDNDSGSVTAAMDVYAYEQAPASVIKFYEEATCETVVTVDDAIKGALPNGTVEVAYAPAVDEYTYKKNGTTDTTIYSNDGGKKFFEEAACTTPVTFLKANIVKGADTGKTTTLTGSVTTKSYNVAKFTKDVENIELEDNNGFYFDVKASDQGKLNLAYDNVAIKSVARVAPVDADLTFYNFYGYPTFDFTGKVTITPEEDDVEYFVYQVSKDGKISKVNAKLNEDGDAYEFKTRTLGCYVLSDMELNVDEVNNEETPEAPADGEGTVAPEPGKENPGTGC